MIMAVSMVKLVSSAKKQNTMWAPFPNRAPTICNRTGRKNLEQGEAAEHDVGALPEPGIYIYDLLEFDLRKLHLFGK